MKDFDQTVKNTQDIQIFADILEQMALNCESQTRIISSLNDTVDRHIAKMKLLEGRLEAQERRLIQLDMKIG